VLEVANGRRWGIRHYPRTRLPGRRTSVLTE
jgi:hypothetical protein